MAKMANFILCSLPKLKITREGAAVSHAADPSWMRTLNDHEIELHTS